MTTMRLTFGDRIYRTLYDFVRKTPSLNYLAHRIMQSEAIHHFPPYRLLYEAHIRRTAERYMRVPPFLEITVTDACNARCIMCPPEVHLGKDIMPHEMFERIVLEAEELGIRKMNISGGEPLIDKRLFDKIRFAKAHGFTYIHMFTNGSLLDEKRSRALIESGVDSLTWSIDSPRKSEYEIIRVNLNFDKVITNIRRFMEIRRELGSKTPLTRVNMVALPENQHSRTEFREFFGEFVDIVEIIDSHNFAGSQPNLNTGLAHEYSQKMRYPCHLLFSKIIVFPNGNFKKCSIDYSPHGIMGNLNTQTLREILTSERVREIKEAHLKGVYNQPGCDVCTHKESWWVTY